MAVRVERVNCALLACNSMAVDWNREQHGRVEQVLANYPIESDRCETAAWQLWPIGREVDALAEVWQLLPAEGRYIAPKVGGVSCGFIITT
jgi:hypothetical protein